MCYSNVRNVRPWQVNFVWREVPTNVNNILCFYYDLIQDLTFSASPNYDPWAVKLTNKVDQRFIFERGRIFPFVISYRLCLDRTQPPIQCVQRELSLRIKLMDWNNNGRKFILFSL
jgi:hypothetical protein